jgi:NAD(P)-dependent dehydrogenase (short-subunit alcohol dehydrogenase family)
MKDFSGKLAVITGGGTGMGRELAHQLIAEGCDVAICDVIAENMAETKRLCEAKSPQGKVVSEFQCDVSSETELLAWRDHIKSAHKTDHINLLFNNAGVAGGGSFINDDRDHWERTFNICWNGVYQSTRVFLPMLIASDEGHLVNTSSINGFWASLGPHFAHTAYSTAKFAVKGFTESLVNDFRLHAPHVKVSLVMPGHIGTDIAINSRLIHGGKQAELLTDAELIAHQRQITASGTPVDHLSLEDIRKIVDSFGNDFKNKAPVTAAEGARMILDGVKAEKWRILLGEDAHRLDEAVRANPEDIYEVDFFKKNLVPTLGQEATED